MATGNSSQSQPSYLHYTVEEKPNFQAIQTFTQMASSSQMNVNQTVSVSINAKQLMDQSAAIQAMEKIAQVMTNEDGLAFQDALHSLNVIFDKGYSYLFITHTLLMRKMMNHFTKLGRELQDDSNNSQLQLRMLYILSLIAELLRSNPKFYYPFTRKFLITVFSIDAQLIQNSPIRKQILAVLSVLYENLSRQPKLVLKYGIEYKLKQVVLSVYPLIEEVFTLKGMNKIIANLVAKGVKFSVNEFKQAKLEETVSKIIAQGQMDLFFVKMKMTMLNLDMQKKRAKSKMTQMSENRQDTFMQSQN